MYWHKTLHPEAFGGIATEVVSQRVPQSIL
jgi:hypothetical protein